MIIWDFCLRIATLNDPQIFRWGWLCIFTAPTQSVNQANEWQNFLFLQKSKIRLQKPDPTQMGKQEELQGQTSTPQ